MPSNESVQLQTDLDKADTVFFLSKTINWKLMEKNFPHYSHIIPTFFAMWEVSRPNQE